MYYFIVNPLSRSGKGREIWNRIEKKLQQNPVEYEVYFTRKPGHAASLAYKIAGFHIPCILGVVGGDGTLNEVVNGLADTDFSHILLGYIPTGSGNDFGRGIGLDNDPETALENLLHPSNIIHMDMGIARYKKEKRYFLISTGIGFDASICHEALHSDFKRILNRFGLGKLTYVIIALKQLFLYRPCSAAIRIDGHKVFRLPRFFFITGMNLKYEGGGCKFCPDAEFHDGRIDICTVGKVSKLKILFLFPTAFFGKHIFLRGVHINKGRRIEIVCSRPLPVHCDGESFGCCDRLTITTAKRQISVIAQVERNEYTI